jgi:hypothetical protein
MVTKKMLTEVRQKKINDGQLPIDQENSLRNRPFRVPNKRNFEI